MKTLKGYLREVSNGAYYFHTTDDQIITVKDADGIPCNIPINLTATGLAMTPEHPAQDGECVAVGYEVSDG